MAFERSNPKTKNDFDLYNKCATGTKNRVFVGRVRLYSGVTSAHVVSIAIPRALIRDSKCDNIVVETYTYKITHPTVSSLTSDNSIYTQTKIGDLEISFWFSGDHNLSAPGSSIIWTNGNGHEEHTIKSNYARDLKSIQFKISGSKYKEVMAEVYLKRE